MVYREPAGGDTPILEWGIPGDRYYPNKVQQIQSAGYIPVANFIMPEECWTDNFYILQKKAQEIFLSKYPDNAAAANLIGYQRHEAELYSKYKQYYGYVFYIGKKI